VIVSRGQLIEIGGAFRLPDVLAKSGATLVEVGTTNRTYGTDYRNAWTSNTAILMRSHPSNYRVEGFTAEVDASALAAMAKEFSVISFEDLGSGALVDLARFGLPHEPTLAEEIAAGVDIVAVSGDKLLGGPQCGIIAGRRSLIDVMKRNPLLRALRVDKMTLSALSATLSIYLEPERLCEIPFFAMLSVTRDELTARATAICAALRGRVQADVEPIMTSAAIGGGSFPNAEIPSAGVCVHPRDRSVNALCAALRRGRPPIIGRVDERSLTLDLRTVPPDQDAVLADALIAASPCE
jgi:L-seryl-tRNA(Ser) seleniumtransferase